MADRHASSATTSAASARSAADVCLPDADRLAALSVDAAAAHPDMLSSGPSAAAAPAADSPAEDRKGSEGAAAAAAAEAPGRVRAQASSSSGGDAAIAGSRSGVRARAFSEQCPDGILHFNVVRLSHDQLYVWVGYNERSHGNVHAALPTRFDAMPLVTQLVGGSSGTPDSVGASMASRIAKRAKCAVLLACNIPSNSPMLEAMAERRVVQEVTSWSS